MISILLQLEDFRIAASVPNIAPSHPPAMENEATFDDQETPPTATEREAGPLTNTTVERQLIGLPYIRIRCTFPWGTSPY
jgi:hypothetical protein